MRIFNGTKKVLTLPYTGGETLTIPAHQPSGNVLCSSEFLSLIITAYNTDEIAVIASGPFEISACANIPTATNYVVQSLDEAIERFNSDTKKPKPEEPEPKVEEPEPKKEEEEPKPEEPKVEEEPKQKVEEPKTEPKKEKKAKKAKVETKE